MTEQLEEGIQQVKNIIRMEDFDLTEGSSRLLVTPEQFIEYASICVYKYGINVYIRHDINS